MAILFLSVPMSRFKYLILFFFSGKKKNRRCSSPVLVKVSITINQKVTCVIGPPGGPTGILTVFQARAKLAIRDSVKYDEPHILEDK